MCPLPLSYSQLYYEPHRLLGGLLSLVLLAAVPATSAAAQQTVCEGQVGDAAISCIQANYSPSGTLGYDTARDTLYARIDASASGQLEGIYSGFTITLAPGEDPTGDAFDKGINAEHVYPQSKGAGSEPRKSDMHNLRPSRTTVNSARGSLPFGESPDNQTDDWYFEDNTQSSTPDSGIDAWSERLDGSVFEPREAKEGDVARAIFYFYSVYRPSAEDAFFENMKSQLLQWHQADPPTEAELARSEAIARRQGNENPFVLDPTLAERAFSENDGQEPILSETFDDDLGQFFQFSVTSNANWTHETDGGDGFAQMNGFGADEASNDWLISPALDLSDLESAELVAEIGKQFDGPDLKLQVSTDYSGSGDPTTAAWTEERTVGSTGTITTDLSGYVGSSSVYVAFQYTSTGTGAGDGAAFTVDDVTVGPGAPGQLPIARADTFSTPQGQALTVSAPGVLENDSDPDGDSLSASLISGTTGGSLTLGQDGSVEYVPDTSFTGTDSFTYAAAAGGAADTATATIEVESAGAPVTIAEARSQGPGATVTVEGTVSRAFGAYARLQDESGPTGASGLVIRQTAGSLSEDFQDDIAAGVIEPGTALRVTGTLSAFSGLIQVNNDDLIGYSVQGQGEPPAPQAVSLTDLQGPGGEDYESELIEVEGLSFPAASGTFEPGTTYEIQGEGGTSFDFRVQDSSATAVIGAPIPENSFTYRGVLGQFDEFTGDDEGYQLIPIRPSDLETQPGGEFPPTDALSIVADSAALTPPSGQTDAQCLARLSTGKLLFFNSQDGGIFSVGETGLTEERSSEALNTDIAAEPNTIDRCGGVVTDGNGNAYFLLRASESSGTNSWPTFVYKLPSPGSPSVLASEDGLRGLAHDDGMLYLAGVSFRGAPADGFFSIDDTGEGQSLTTVVQDSELDLDYGMDAAADGTLYAFSGEFAEGNFVQKIVEVTDPSDSPALSVFTDPYAGDSPLILDAGTGIEDLDLLTFEGTEFIVVYNGSFEAENGVQWGAVRVEDQAVELLFNQSQVTSNLPVDSYVAGFTEPMAVGPGGDVFAASRSAFGASDYILRAGAAGENLPPVAAADSFSVPQGQTLTVGAPGVLGNDSDPNGDSLSASLVSGVSNGSLTLDGDGSFEYAPDSSFTGTDQFTYVASDGSLADTTAVTIEVGPAGDCPLAWSLGVSGTDAAGDSLSVTFGQSEAATAGIDPACGEEEQPPKPPSDVFDLRFTGTDLPGVGLGEGLIRDIRPTDTPTPAPEAESAPATWRLEVQSDSYPVTLTWDSAALADSLPDVPVRLVDVVTGGDLVDVDMKSTGSYTLENSSVTALEVRLDRALTREVPIASGWNLLSVPLEVEDPSFGAVLPPCESGFFFEPGSGYNGIAEGEAVPVGRGLFANCSAGTAQVTGQAPGPTIEVAQGWNIIGALADSIAVESITSDPAGIVESSFFGFDQTSGYQNASALAPGGGYWVKAGESGVLDLSGSGEAAALASTQATSKSQKRSGAELRLTDAAGREATLRLTSELTEAQRKQGALPPVPPGGMFDVRFEGGRSVAETGDALKPIETQGLKAPVTVQLANAEEGQSIQVQQSSETMRLAAESPSAELSQVEGLAVGLQAAPEAFALKKTYPNPASGRATVEYALPEQAEVTIAVYDVLGRRVATLADGREEAGRHTAVLDAGQMPSGTYFVRMRAEGFRQTRRVTVVR